MSTPYSEENQELTDKAHYAARMQIYPLLFKLPPGNLEFVNTTLRMGYKERQLDGEMAIDRIVKVQPTNNGLKPISFTVQERFREPEYAKYEDITITEWNPITNLPSELYKLHANLFMYGYYDKSKNTFLDVVVFDVAKTLMGICNKKIYFGRGKNPRTQQPFITISFVNLARAGCLLFRLKDTISYSQNNLFFNEWSST